MTRDWIEFPRIEGKASHQAHADLPDGVFEREIGRDGFYGPAAHLYHRHPPTGWTSFQGPLRPRAFDAKAAAPVGAPLEGAVLLSNPHCSLFHLVLRESHASAGARCGRRSASVHP